MTMMMMTMMMQRIGTAPCMLWQRVRPSVTIICCVEMANPRHQTINTEIISEMSPSFWARIHETRND